MKIQDYLKLIPDYPSDLPGFRLSEVVRWPAFKCYMLLIIFSHSIQINFSQSEKNGCF